ncbi:MAG: FAD-dependent thymidylate synthase [Clostridiales bacterium]|nr:FAD-dependent thymidylate synthase [Clostridiales bacterium]
MPEQKKLKVILLRHTLSPEETVALAAKLCYSKSTISDLNEKISSKDQSDFIAKLMDMGHESVLEHASFTFGVEGVSRVLLAQLTRHRIASFSVQSQRYVSYENGFGYIIPDSIAALGEEYAERFHEQMKTIESWYTDWQKLLGTGEKSNEDARFVLPNACETRIMVTMNVRELRHFFSLRMCNRAQWEIRRMAEEMFRLCFETAPALFMNAGPACIRGKCPEGEKSCGQAARIREAREKLIHEAAKEN